MTGDLCARWTNLNRLMEANAANIEGTMSHLNAITGDMAVCCAEKNNLKAPSTNLTRFSEMLGDNSPARGQHHRQFEPGFRPNLADEGSPAGGALDSTLMNLNAILARVAQGEGTVGKLMNDPALYESLNEATANLASLLANLRAHPARYVHFSLFGRDPEKADRKQQKKEAKHARRDSLKALKAAR